MCSSDLLLVEMILLFFVGLFSTILKFYAAISLGQLAKKRKILCSFLAFLGLNIVTGFITSMLYAPLGTLLSSVQDNLMEGLIIAQSSVMFAVAVNIVFGVVYFLISNYIMKKKLNLE